MCVYVYIHVYMYEYGLFLLLLSNHAWPASSLFGISTG